MHPFPKIRLIALLSLLFLSACNRPGFDDASLYPVSYSDFENVIVVEGVVEPLHSISIACPAFIDGTIVYMVEDGTFIEKDGVVCTIEDVNLSNNYDASKLALENAVATLNKTRANLEMQYALLASQVETNEADAKIAQMDSLQLVYATPNQRRITELELESSAITRAKFDKKLEALAVIQQSEIRRWELEIKTLSDRLATVEQRMDQLSVKAPQDGLLIRATSWLTGQKMKAGDPVWGNMPIATIPKMTAMKIKIRTSEREFKQIGVNDSVTYLFDAMPENVAFGRITNKVPVGQPVKNGSKVKLFEIEASIDSLIGMPEPGFTANCRVISQSVKNVLVVPQIAIFEQDSVKVAYVPRRRGYEMRQVEIGASSLREAVITDGLKAGERVLLTKPKPSLVNRRTFMPKKPAPRDPANDSIFKYIPLWKLEPDD